MTRCALIALAASLIACGDGPEIPPLAPDARVLAFGDSLTHGTGAEPDDSYPARLERLIGREVIRSGVPGELSSEGLRRLPGVLDRVQPALLILCHGGNDILRGHDPEQSRANLAAMVRTALDRGIAVVLLGVPERRLFTETADHYQAVAEEFAIPLENEVIADIVGDPSLKSDRVHPNAAGYHRMAGAVHELLIEAGALE